MPEIRELVEIEMRESPVEKVIAAFGGINDFSSIARISKKRVYRWRQASKKGGRDGRVPDDAQPLILRAARELGIALSAEDLIDMRDPAPSVPEDVQ